MLMAMWLLMYVFFVHTRVLNYLLLDVCISNDAFFLSTFASLQNFASSFLYSKRYRDEVISKNYSSLI